MRIRLMALSHINNGVNPTQTAKYLHVSCRMVNEWVKRFNEKVIDGLIEKPCSGSPRAFTRSKRRAPRNNTRIIME
jgi:transposase